jgi:hypothetical protein
MLYLSQFVSEILPVCSSQLIKSLHVSSFWVPSNKILRTLLTLLRGVRKIAKSDYRLRHVCSSVVLLSLCLFVRMEQLGSYRYAFS